MRKLLLTPSQAGYSAQLGNEVLTAALAGGPSRQRRDFIGAVAFVNVSWNLGPVAFDYLEAFYRQATANASEPFLLDIILDQSPLVEYQVKFVPGSYAIGGVQGLTTTINAQLEVQPLVIPAATDEAVLLLYETAGEDAETLLVGLARLVIEDWPSWLGG